MKKTLTTLFAIIVLASGLQGAAKETPKFINIVNFIRQVEPRIGDGLEEELYQTTARQVEIMNENGLKGTFLIQYDAMINPRYQYLLKVKLKDADEIGAWWEITEPHVKAAGLQWRGRYPWDWHANVGFSTGYTQEERKVLVDVFMERFKEIFGHYPKSVGSWFIDAFTLNYMYEKYGIVASCTCKDQIGTDGYTMWGGYWNQAYYPSKVNAYMPAQTEEGQIPVPVFRMLGSDPVYQYDNGLGTQMQGVVTLEPVYTGNGGGGGVREWVDWYLDMIAKGECLTFNYVQAGQENSFTWDRMRDGYEYQIPVIKEMSDKGMFKVCTLAECGEWFRKSFRVTPPSSVVADDDFMHSAKRSVWYDSRFYRVNLYWDGVDFRFRDIHLFDERIESDYYAKPGTSTQCVYTTLPVVDGFLWSKPENLAGLRIVCDGERVSIASPTVSRRGSSTLTVKGSTRIGKIRITLKEDRIEVRLHSRKRWSLELGVADGCDLPFNSVEPGTTISAEDHGHDYCVRLARGRFEGAGTGSWRIVPERGRAVIATSVR